MMKKVFLTFFICNLAVYSTTSLDQQTPQASHPHAQEPEVPDSLEKNAQPSEKTSDACPQETTQAPQQELPSQEKTSVLASLQKPDEKKEPKKVCQRAVTIHNKITDDMATYKKHWSGNHTPRWNLTVNKCTIESDQKAEIVLLNTDNLTLEFYFEFYALGRLHRKGTAVAQFSINDECRDLDVEFSWDKEERLVVKNKTISAENKAEPLLLTFNEKS
jgi:hypothetical protein